MCIHLPHQQCLVCWPFFMNWKSTTHNFGVVQRSRTQVTWQNNGHTVHPSSDGGCLENCPEKLQLIQNLSSCWRSVGYKPRTNDIMHGKNISMEWKFLFWNSGLVLLLLNTDLSQFLLTLNLFYLRPTIPYVISV